MDSPEQPDPTPSERRAVGRSGGSTPVSVTLENPAFAGRADSLSAAGVFFFSADRLRVRVEYEAGGVRQTRTGCLVRVQRMSAETTGYAIEFDR